MVKTLTTCGIKALQVRQENKTMWLKVSIQKARESKQLPMHIAELVMTRHRKKKHRSCLQEPMAQLERKGLVCSVGLDDGKNNHLGNGFHAIQEPISKSKVTQREHESRGSSTKGMLSRRLWKIRFCL